MRISIPRILICEHCGNSDFMGQTTDLDLVRDGLLWRVGDETLAAPEHLHRVPHVAVVYRNLQLALAGLRGVHWNRKWNLSNTSNSLGRAKCIQSKNMAIAQLRAIVIWQPFLNAPETYPVSRSRIFESIASSFT